MMDEITNSLKEVLKRRSASPLYGTFLISWIIFHWEFIFSLFFLSEEKIWEVTHLLKNEYLVEHFFNTANFYFWISWIAPFILTWLIIWILPDLLFLRAHSKDTDYRIKRRLVDISGEIQIENQKISLEKKRVTAAQLVAEKTDAEKKTEQGRTARWVSEFEKFRENPTNLSALLAASRAFYEKRGHFSTEGSNPEYRIHVPASFLSKLDVLGLIEKSKEEDVLYLTEKGKFFLKEYQERGQK